MPRNQLHFYAPIWTDHQGKLGERRSPFGPKLFCPISGHGGQVSPGALKLVTRSVPTLGGWGAPRGNEGPQLVGGGSSEAREGPWLVFLSVQSTGWSTGRPRLPCGSRARTWVGVLSRPCRRHQACISPIHVSLSPPSHSKNQEKKYPLVKINTPLPHPPLPPKSSSSSEGTYEASLGRHSRVDIRSCPPDSEKFVGTTTGLHTTLRPQGCMAPAWGHYRGEEKGPWGDGRDGRRVTRPKDILPGARGGGASSCPDLARDHPESSGLARLPPAGARVRSPVKSGSQGRL